MTLVPAALERWILAGLLLLPAAALLAPVALEGQAGRLTAGVVVAAAVLYAAIAWLAGLRREVARQAAAAPRAPDDARLEALAATAGRAGARALGVLGVALVTAAVDLLAIGLAIALGIGLVAALTALALGRAEGGGRGRLVRRSAPPWAPAPPLQRY
jgi:hypothetical protein